MSVKDDKVTAPVGLGEVADLLNESSLDVGRVCCSTYINPWARYKPERFTQVEPLTDQQRRSNNWGMQIAASPNPYTLYQNLAIDNWLYLRPRLKEGTGGATLDTYRLTDFINEDGTKGYDHNASNPLPSLRNQVIYVSPSHNFNRFTIPVAYPIMPASSDTVLRSNDFTVVYGGTVYNVADLYLGIVLRDADGNYFFCTNSQPGIGNLLSVCFNRDLTTKTYYGVLMASSESCAPGESYKQGAYVPLGQITPVELIFKLESSQYVIRLNLNLTGLKSPGLDTYRATLSGTVTFMNQSNASVTFPAMRLFISTSMLMVGYLPQGIIYQEDIISNATTGSSDWPVGANKEMTANIKTTFTANTEDSIYVYVTSSNTGSQPTFNSGNPRMPFMTNTDEDHGVQ